MVDKSAQMDVEEKPEFATTKQFKTSDLIKRIKVSEQKDKDKKGNIRSTYESISPSCENRHSPRSITNTTTTIYGKVTPFIYEACCIFIQDSAVQRIPLSPLCFVSYVIVVTAVIIVIISAVVIIIPVVLIIYVVVSFLRNN